MSLRFVFGRAGRGKSTFCFNEIKKGIEQGENRKYILLVPEQLTFSSENKLVNTIEKDEDFKAEVLSFRTLGNRIFTEVGGLSHKHITQSGRAMLIFNILSSLSKSLNVFSKSSAKMGFIPNISEVLKELKRFDIEKSDIENIIDKINSETLKGKLLDISNILDEFNEKLHQNYIDEEDEVQLLSRKIEESTYLNDAEVFVDGFEGMNPIQLSVLKEILKKAKRVTVCITGDGGNLTNEGFDLFKGGKEFELSLLKIIKENNIPYEKPVNLNKEDGENRFKNKELAHLEKYAFRFPFKAYTEDTNNIDIFTASNLYSEVKRTSNEIIKLVRDENYKYKDIAVVARNMEKYESLIKGIFIENNIPIYIDKKSKATQNPIVVLLISALEVQKRRWSYEAVFTYLKSGLIDVNIEDINILENYVIENGIKGKKWLESFKTYSNRNLDGEEKESETTLLQKINETREKVITPLNTFHTNLKNSKTARDMCREVYDFILSIGVDKKISDIIEKCNADGNILLAREYAQVFDILIDLLDQAVEIMGEEAIRVNDFIDILVSGLSECTIGSIPSVIDSVLVTAADRMKTQTSKVLFILGVNDGVFPSPILDEGIINDLERSEIKLAGLKIDLDTKEKAFNEQYLIYKVLTSSSEKVKLSYPIADHEGKTLRQSIILHRLKKVFPKMKIESDLVDLKENDIENITTKNPTFNSLILKIRNFHETGDIDKLWLDTFRWFKENGYNFILDSLLNGLLYTSQVDKVSKEKIKELYGGKKFSVSQIETYTKCPYSYFVKYGLKAKERREFGFKALEIGSFMHKVLEDFSDVIKKEAEDLREIEKDFIEEVVEVIVNEMLEKLPNYILNSSARYKFLGKRLKRLIVNAIWVITEHIKAGDFEAVGYEEGFGMGEKFPPILINLENGETVELVGKIDRLDEANINGEKFIRIVDYKSSKRKINLSDIYYGLQIQLLVYLDAILESYEKTQIAYPGGMFYFKLDEPIISAESRLSKEEAEEKILEEFKMEGLLLKDKNLVYSMDKLMKDSSKSKIIPAAFKKDGDFTSSTNAVTLDEFNILREYVKYFIGNKCTEMLSGEISINPHKKGDNTPCDWCEYSPICQFDTSFLNNSYNTIKDLKNDVALEKMEKEVE